MLMDSVGQEFRRGPSRIACSCSMIPEVSAYKDLRLWWPNCYGLGSTSLIHSLSGRWVERIWRWRWRWKLRWLCVSLGKDKKVLHLTEWFQLHRPQQCLVWTSIANTVLQIPASSGLSLFPLFNTCSAKFHPWVKWLLTFTMTMPGNLILSINLISTFSYFFSPWASDLSSPP